MSINMTSYNCDIVTLRLEGFFVFIDSERLNRILSKGIMSSSSSVSISDEFTEFLDMSNEAIRKVIESHRASLVGGRPALAMIIEREGVRPILAMSSSKFGGWSAGTRDDNRVSGRSANTCNVIEQVSSDEFK